MKLKDCARKYLSISTAHIPRLGREQKRNDELRHKLQNIDMAVQALVGIIRKGAF